VAVLGESAAQAWREEKRGREGVVKPRVVLAFYRGPGLLGVEMLVSNGRRFMPDAIDVRGGGGVNGDSRGGIKEGE
jgi:hypothetical protein